MATYTRITHESWPEASTELTQSECNHIQKYMPWLFRKEGCPVKVETTTAYVFRVFGTHRQIDSIVNEATYA